MTTNDNEGNPKAVYFTPLERTVLGLFGLGILGGLGFIGTKSSAFVTRCCC